MRELRLLSESRQATGPAMCVGSRAVAGGSLQEWLSVRHLGLDHAQTGSGPQLISPSGFLPSSLGIPAVCRAGSPRVKTLIELQKDFNSQTLLLRRKYFAWRFALVCERLRCTSIKHAANAQTAAVHPCQSSIDKKIRRTALCASL